MNTLRNLYIKYNYYIASFILLSIGALIYILFRPQNLLIFDMLDKMGLSNEVDSIVQKIKSIKYDKIYKNNGTLKDLANTAGDFIEEIIHARRY